MNPSCKPGFDPAVGVDRREPLTDKHSVNGIDRQTERAVQRLALEALLSSIDHFIWWKDLDGRFLGCNRAFARKHGFDAPRDLVGLTDYDIPLYEGMADVFKVDDAQVAATRIPIKNRETSTKHPDAEDHTSFSKVPLIDHRDEVVGILGISTDITRRVRMEQQLAAERNLLDEVLSTIPYQIAWKDRDGRFLGANTSYRTLVGLEPGRPIEGLLATDLPVAPPEGRDGAARGDEAVLSSGVNQLRQPVELVDEDGQVHKVEISRVALVDMTGRINGLLTIYADQTDKFQLERQLAEASKLEAIGQLAAGVAHEINTPIQYVGDNLAFLTSTSAELTELLSAARSMAEKVAGGTASAEDGATLLRAFEQADLDFLFDEVPRAVEQSLEGVERVRTIVRALKDFAHPGSERPEPTDVNRVIESTVSVATNEWKYVAEIELDLDPGLPLAECQPGQLGQVVLILVVNAAHAIGKRYGEDGDKGAIEIRSRSLGRAIEISVSDDGGGIPDDVLPRVFEPFFTTKEVGKGTGQGLSLAHNIVVRDHGGALSVDTAVGSGTTFTVTIPIRASENGRADVSGRM